MILVASVMHTGTLFTIKRILPDYDVEQVHFTDKHINRMIDRVKGCKHVIIPLRHPARCLEAFKRRSKEYSYFTEQWDNMLNMAGDMSPYYIHIDDIDRRDDDIKRLCVRTGGDIDWTPSIHAGMKTHTYDLEITDDMVKEIPKRYIDFYEADKYEQ